MQKNDLKNIWVIIDIFPCTKYVFFSDAARELISREFSRISAGEIIENEFSILEKLIFQKYVVIRHFEDIRSEIIL